MNIVRSFALVSVLIAGLTCPACSKSDPADGGAPATSALPPVPAPPGLLADVVLPTPDASWGKARSVAGGPTAFLPQSFGGLAATFLGLPIAVAGEIDGAIPALGAVVDGGADAPPRGAVAIHVRAGERFIDQLTKGDGARFKPRVDPPSSIIVLDPKDGAAGPAALGVLGNYLLVAKAEADLLAIGPYVARTLPVATPPKNDLSIDVPRAAIAGPVRAWIGKATGFLREQPGASSGDATASAMFAPLLSALDVLGDASSARLAIDLDDKAVRARATIVPNEAAGPAQAALGSMVTGDARPILELPGASVGALLLRESAAMRAASAKRQADAVAGLVGKTWSPADRESLASTLAALAEARGDWMVGGVNVGGPRPSAYFRAAVLDAEKLKKAMKDLAVLLKRPSIKAELAEAGFGVSAGKAKVPGVSGDVDRLRIERSGPKEAKLRPEPGLPTSVDVLYAVENETLWVAVGLDAGEALATLIAAPGKEDLSKNPLVAAGVQSLGSEVALAVVVEPVRIVGMLAGKPDAAESAPVLIAFGRSAPGEPAPRGLWLRVDVANPAIRELVRRRGAL